MGKTPAVAAVLFTMVIWGIGPLFIRAASLSMGAADSLVIRYALISLIYGLVLAVNSHWRVAREDWPRLLVVSLIGMFGYNLGSVFGFQWVPAGIGGLIIGSQPLLIVLLAALLTRERLTAIMVAGVVIAFAGMPLLLWNDLSAPGSDVSLLLGAVFIFLSGLAWALYVVLSKPLIDKYGSLQVAVTSILIAFLPILGFASASTLETLAAMGWKEWGVMFYLVVPSGVIATVLWNFAVGRLSPAASGAFLYLVPVIAVAAGAIVFDEPVTPQIMLGGLMILSGVAIAQAGPRLARQS